MTDPVPTTYRCTHCGTYHDYIALDEMTMRRVGVPRLVPLNDGTPPAVDSNQPCNVVGMLKEAACRLRDQTARLFPHLALSDDPLQAMQQAARAIGLRAPTWERRAEQAAKYDLAPEEDLPAVAGEKIGRSFSDMHRALLVSIDEEQRKPLPDAALVGLLCDSVRLLRLHCKGNAS